MTYTYTPKNVCSRSITINVNENDIVESVSFVGGCNGNLKGISKLVEGMNVNDVIETMRNAKYIENKMYCYEHFIRDGVFMDKKVIDYITPAQIIEITNILNN